MSRRFESKEAEMEFDMKYEDWAEPATREHKNVLETAFSFGDIAATLDKIASESAVSDVLEDQPCQDQQIPLLDSDDEDIPLHITFWALTMTDMMAQHATKYAADEEAQRIPRRGEDLFQFARGEKRFKSRPGRTGFYANECEGDRRVRKIRQIYTSGFRTRIRAGNDPGAFRSITPSDDQLLFMEECLFASLPKIYGKADWNTHHVRVLKEWGRNEIDYFVMVITGRRVGKTFSVSMFDAAVLLSVPGITISVYSTGRRASKMLKELVEKLVLMTGDDAAKRIIQSNMEEFFISNQKLSDDSTKRSAEAHALRNSTTTARLFSYPSSTKGKHKTPKGTRGKREKERSPIKRVGFFTDGRSTDGFVLRAA